MAVSSQEVSLAVDFAQIFRWLSRAAGAEIRPDGMRLHSIRVHRIDEPGRASTKFLMARLEICPLLLCHSFVRIGDPRSEFRGLVHDRGCLALKIMVELLACLRPRTHPPSDIAHDRLMVGGDVLFGLCDLMSHGSTVSRPF
jgi:hypothetical protein